MKTFLKTIFLVFPLLLVSWLALAGGGSAGGHHEVDWLKSFIYPLLNFLILVLILVVLARKGVVESFRFRSRKTKKDIEDSSQLYNQIKIKFDEIDGKLSQVRQEGETLVKDVELEAKQEHQRILDSAKQAAERIEKDSKRIIDQEVRRARELLKEEAVRLASGLATDQLKNLGAEQQKNLADEFIQVLQKEPGQ